MKYNFKFRFIRFIMKNTHNIIVRKIFDKKKKGINPANRFYSDIFIVLTNLNTCKKNFETKKYFNTCKR